MFEAKYDPGIMQVVSLIQEEGLNYSCAWDIFYLRSSANWTIELETELKKRHSEGRPPVDLAKFINYQE